MQATELFQDLVRVETRLYNAADARLRAEHDLALGQFEFLTLIEQVPNCRVQDIARDIAITVGATSKAVDRLERAGLCRREANPGDRRSSILVLTDLGREKLEAARPTLERELVALTRGVAGLEDLLRGSEMLQAMRVSLERRGEEPEG